MKPSMMIASIAVVASVAIAACSSNKPAEDATSQNGPVAATTGPTDLYQPNGASTVPLPSGEPVEGTPTTPTANRNEPTPSDVTGPNRPATDVRTSNAPSTVGTPPPPQPPAPTEPDNTRMNKRDRSANAPTPMDQGNNESDLKITQQIRQAVMADGSLSFTAKNVKIITANGKVVLRGPVKTDQERLSIVASARKVAGDANVDDQIEVKK